MRTRKYIRTLLMFTIPFLLFSGLTACHSGNSSPSGSGDVLLNGQTPGGTPFNVFTAYSEDNWETLQLQIGDHDAITLEKVNSGLGLRAVVESIEVKELEGEFSFFHISWHDNVWNHATDSAQHYLLVAAQDPSLIVLRQRCTFDFSGHYMFSWKRGAYDLEYTGDTLRVLEHWKVCEGDGCGSTGSFTLTETQLERSFHIDAFGSEVTLSACEERSRKAGPFIGETEYSHQGLHPPLPGKWTVSDMSINDSLVKCRPLDHTY